MPPIDMKFTNLDDEYTRAGIFLYSNDKIYALEGNDKLQVDSWTGNGIYNIGTIDTGDGDDSILNKTNLADESTDHSALFNGGTISLGTGNDTLRSTISKGNAAIYIQRDTTAKRPGTIDLGSGDDSVYAERTKPNDNGSLVAIINEGGLLLAGEGDDKITAIGTILNMRKTRKYGGLEIGLIDLGEGANTLEGKGSTGIFNFGKITGGSGNDHLIGYGLGPLSGYYAGIENRGTVDRKGNWVSDATSIDTGSGDDSIIGRGERGIFNASIIITGEGNDRISGIGTLIGIENWADIDLGAGNDIIIGEGAQQGIINNGLINTGDGDDEINAMVGGFFYEYDKYEFSPTPTRGVWNLGKGDDLVKGFGTGSFWGGEGLDTIKLGEGSYKISGGKISLKNKFNQIVEMVISGFEQIGGVNGGLVNISDGDIIIDSDGHLKTNPPTTPAPTYSLTPSVTTINEGATLTTSITTTNVPSGTTLYYDLSGTGISAADFSSGSLNGQLTTGSNGSASFSHTLANDLTTEGPETLQIKLFSDSARTIQVGSTASVAISDTSTTPAPTISSIGGTDKIVSSVAGDNQLLLTAAAGSTVKLYSGSTLLGTASPVTGQAGSFSYSLTPTNLTTLGQGTGKSITATVTDSAGNTSAASAAFTFAVQTSPPAAPTISSIGGTDKIVSSVAGDNQLLLTAAAGSTVKLYSGSTLLGTASPVTGQAGSFSYSLTRTNLTTLRQGTGKSITATVTDSAGNTSAASAVFNFGIFNTAKSVVSASSAILAANKNTLALSGTADINGTGNARNNTLVGNLGKNILDGKDGKDILTGLGGADTFKQSKLSDSLLGGFDTITDLEIGTDFIDGPNAVSASSITKLGSVSSLSEANIKTALTNANFRANGAATFSHGIGSEQRTFLAMNDSTAGFDASTDAILEITGYKGNLSKLSII